MGSAGLSCRQVIITMGNVSKPWRLVNNQAGIKIVRHRYANGEVRWIGRSQAVFVDDPYIELHLAQLRRVTGLRFVGEYAAGTGCAGRGLSVVRKGSIVATCIAYAPGHLCITAINIGSSKVHIKRSSNLYHGHCLCRENNRWAICTVARWGCKVNQCHRDNRVWLRSKIVHIGLCLINNGGRVLAVAKRFALNRKSLIKDALLPCAVVPVGVYS